jgi:NAD(P)-dependent dehydrogenase (short-subunit alcohol dehydrogenase family)
VSFLKGRTVVITGGGRGIGRAVALAYAAAGARVIVTSRTAPEVEETARLITAAGGSAHAAPGDTADEATAARVISFAVAQGGSIDVLINAAGINGPVGAVEDIALAEWEHLFRVNLTGTFLFCRAAIPRMKRQKSGLILNVVSGLARRVQPGLAAYSASKAAIAHFSSVLAEEVQASGIRVNAIHPGIVKTALVQELMALRAAGARGDVVGRLQNVEQSGMMISAEESARLFLMLASPLGADLTGRFISADEADIKSRLSRFSVG